MDHAIAPRPVITMDAVESSQIDSIGYHPETNTLAVRFKNWKGEPSSLYHYANFTAEDFAKFKDAESIGSHFGKYIKPFDVKHPFTKIS